MRLLINFCAVLLLCGLAMAQAPSASSPSWPAPGVYAAPFVPLVTTPSVTLAPALPAVGASNGTADNVAGAVNTTLSISSTGPAAVFQHPVWYGSSAAPEASVAVAPTAGRSPTGGAFEFGIAFLEDSHSVIELGARSRRKQTSRVYANPDVSRVNETNGLVSYAGKTMHLD